MPVELRHVQHCNVNCTDLDRSLAFYRDRIGLVPIVRTNPDPQPGHGFGIDGDAQWDAWMMSDGRTNPVVDLLEWKVPIPVGHPYQTADSVGLAQLRFESPDVAEPTVVTDPDGTRLALQPGEATRFAGVVVNVSDLADSSRWYLDTLGLTVRAEDRSRCVLGVEGDEFMIELRGVANPSGARAYTVPNHVGVFRMAFLVDDAATAHDELARLGVESPKPTFLDMGPEVPIDGVWAVFFRDPDGTCLELIQDPQGAAL